MKKPFVILFLLFRVICFSQCEDSNKLEYGGTHLSMTRDYISFEVKHKDSIYHEDISYPQDIKKIEKFSNYILSKAKEYIVSRANIDFFNKLDLQEIQVNYKDSVNADYNDDKFYNLSNYNITYWNLYTYSNKNIKYLFGLEFDKDGKMISENMFPKYSENPEFELLTDYCSALELIKRNTKFKNKKVKYIELAYLDNKNTFCWLIEEEKKPNKELGKWEEHTINQYYVNANSNKLELIDEKKGMSIACGVKLKPLKKLKGKKKSMYKK
jgi:hypothetical protein